ncbi:LOW QUALITY PROTEIN: hypothetical protein BU14_0077s0042 [Porphyra umbilicalis]|uniref:Uncharacterized protein n=1 Tax=Porphyra umbilicalis TaxID=2786 RepID=A0A1X6PEZ3_PORUM|nr:LOW QUALITY PROTEIN: hypothetical protein BU14_0077s0042 [Porphyra umbilicalis]|eukprot:OSX79422.1 LOW QUALITY PROTEIN: hypothetical protein BU14_0077s0042 [Porphyra umbilicalis]
MNNASRPSRNEHQWCHPLRRLAVERGLSRRHDCGPPAGNRRLPRPSDVQNYPVVAETQRCNFECVNEALVHAIGDQLEFSYFFSLFVRLTWPARLVLTRRSFNYSQECGIFENAYSVDSVFENPGWLAAWRVHRDVCALSRPNRLDSERHRSRAHGRRPVPPPRGAHRVRWRAPSAARTPRPPRPLPVSMGCVVRTASTYLDVLAAAAELPPPPPPVAPAALVHTGLSPPLAPPAALTLAAADGGVVRLPLRRRWGNAPVAVLATHHPPPRGGDARPHLAGGGRRCRRQSGRRPPAPGRGARGVTRARLGTTPRGGAPGGGGPGGTSPHCRRGGVCRLGRTRRRSVTAAAVVPCGRRGRRRTGPPGGTIGVLLVDLPTAVRSAGGAAPRCAGGRSRPSSTRAPRSTRRRRRRRRRFRRSVVGGPARRGVTAAAAAATTTPRQRQRGGGMWRPSGGAAAGSGGPRTPAAPSTVASASPTGGVRVTAAAVDGGACDTGMDVHDRDTPGRARLLCETRRPGNTPRRLTGEQCPMATAATVLYTLPPLPRRPRPPPLPSAAGARLGGQHVDARPLGGGAAVDRRCAAAAVRAHTSPTRVGDGNGVDDGAAGQPTPATRQQKAALAAENTSRVRQLKAGAALGVGDGAAGQPTPATRQQKAALAAENTSRVRQLKAGAALGVGDGAAGQPTPATRQQKAALAAENTSRVRQLKAGAALGVGDGAAGQPTPATRQQKAALAGENTSRVRQLKPHVPNWEVTPDVGGGGVTMPPPTGVPPSAPPSASPSGSPSAVEAPVKTNCRADGSASAGAPRPSVTGPVDPPPPPHTRAAARRAGAVRCRNPPPHSSRRPLPPRARAIRLPSPKRGARGGAAAKGAHRVAARGGTRGRPTGANGHRVGGGDASARVGHVGGEEAEVIEEADETVGAGGDGEEHRRRARLADRRRGHRLDGRRGAAAAAAAHTVLVHVTVATLIPLARHGPTAVTAIVQRTHGAGNGPRRRKRRAARGRRQRTVVAVGGAV